MFEVFLSLCSYSTFVHPIGLVLMAHGKLEFAED
jgi:hypothetical protein